jgi:RNA polymerase sigma factor (sigma-70 family)
VPPSNHRSIARFATTHWSVVLAAAAPGSPSADAALGKLCRAYWFPIYAFLRRQGYGPHDAEDLTQAFFARLLEKKVLEGVSPNKGRFRTFLLVCIKRFLCNELEYARALKRGGGAAAIPIDVAGADERFVAELTDETTPEQVFQRRWSLAVLELALRRLADEMQAAGKGRAFEVLRGTLTDQDRSDSYADLAKKLNTTEGAVKVAVFRLRARYGEILRDVVAGTLADPADVEDEIRQLLAALGGRD